MRYVLMVCFILFGIATFWFGGMIWGIIPFTVGNTLIDGFIGSVVLFGLFFVVWTKWGRETAEELEAG